jgi:hypothetical protein
MNESVTDKFDRDIFAESVGSPFRLSAPSGQTVELVLKEVSELKERPGYCSFSIILIVPEPYMIEQGLYDLAHDSFGNLQLFLVPVGKDPEGTQVEAVFTYLPDKSDSVSG